MDKNYIEHLENKIIETIKQEKESGHIFSKDELKKEINLLLKKENIQNILKEDWQIKNFEDKIFQQFIVPRKKIYLGLISIFLAPVPYLSIIGIIIAIYAITKKEVHNSLLAIIGLIFAVLVWSPFVLGFLNGLI